MMKFAFLVLIIAGLAYIRLAPSDVQRWHEMPDFDTDQELAGGVMRVIEPIDQAQFAKLIGVIRASDRVTPLAGSVQDGKITFIARTKWMGFPDYVTLQLRDGRLRIYSRLRFGQSDLGVNARRMDAWLSQVLG